MDPSGDTTMSEAPAAEPKSSSEEHTDPAEHELDQILDGNELGFGTINQEDFEREVAAQADRKVLENAEEDDRRRLEKAEIELAKLQLTLEKARTKRGSGRISIDEREELIRDIAQYQEDIEGLKGDIRDIRGRMKERAEALRTLDSKVPDAEGRLPHETERDYLIRTGKITPFDNLPSVEEDLEDGEIDVSAPKISGTVPLGAQNLRRPGFSQPTLQKVPEVRVEDEDESSGLSSAPETETDEDVPKKRGKKDGKKRARASDSDDDFDPDADKPARKRTAKNGDITSTTETDASDDDFYVGGDIAKKSRKGRAKAKTKAAVGTSANVTRLDDGDERLYQKRLREWSAARRKAREAVGVNVDPEKRDLAEWHLPHPETPDRVFEGDPTFPDALRLPGDLHLSLFEYQIVGVKWLWALHRKESGGILGDEMGLGKTVQIIAFIAGLHYSGMLDKPALIVAPGAVLKQWATEFHDWWPALRVAILHKSGSGMLTSKPSDDDDLEGVTSEDDFTGRRQKSGAVAIVNRVFEKGHILITTYEGLSTYEDVLLDREWGYAVLDEGHKIRNPDTKVSLNCKSLKTKHRIILSGTPIQNNLTELWSLFDFILPGSLGDLPTFREQFEAPIRAGGFRNANNTEVLTASTCAKVLREMIGPYLLRRLKIDVLKDLPPKEEKILRCKLTKMQEQKYREYLDSPEVAKILNGELNSLPGISTLRKICSHPDLADEETLKRTPGYEFGDPRLSGKMQILAQLLAVWKQHGNRVLIFSQSRKVLDVLEKDLVKQGKYKHLRMDGETPIMIRQDLVNTFNNDTSYDVFLATTRVGGLGLNLTGADRVVIFDPDWNPSTDLQARERAWRIGQKKAVKIYRLVTANTIEEKMYARQVYKHHLSQKILTNSEQRRIFEEETVKDLFTLGSSASNASDLFRAAEKTYSSINRPEKPEENDGESAEVEGISGVAGLADYKPPPKTDENGEPTDKDKGRGEQFFMNEIFSTGLESTLEHDAIVGERVPSSSSAANQFAAKIAREAERKLRQSIQITREAKIGTVTWTGRNGTAGRKEKPQKVKSGSSLLAGLKNKGKGGGGGTDRRSLKEQMLEAFRAKGGRMETTEIAEWCGERGIDKRVPERAAEMRRTLKEVAGMVKGTHRWELKGEYRGRR